MAEAETQKPQQRGVWVEKSDTVSVTYGQKRYLIHLNRFTVEGQTWENVKDDSAKAREFREKVIGKFSEDGKLLQEGIFQRAMNAITNTNNAINAISNESNPTYKILTGQKKALEDYLFKNGKAEEAGTPEPVPAQAPIRTGRERTVFAPLAAPQLKKEEPTPVERAPAQLVAPGEQLPQATRTTQTAELRKGIMTEVFGTYAPQQKGDQYSGGTLSNLSFALLKTLGPDYRITSTVYGQQEGTPTTATHIESRGKLPTPVHNALAEYSDAIVVAIGHVMTDQQKQALKKNQAMIKSIEITGADGKKTDYKLLNSATLDAIAAAKADTKITFVVQNINPENKETGNRYTATVTDKQDLAKLKAAATQVSATNGKYSLLHTFDIYSGTYLFMRHDRLATETGRFLTDWQFFGIGPHPPEYGAATASTTYTADTIILTRKQGEMLSDRMYLAFENRKLKYTDITNLPPIPYARGFQGQLIGYFTNPSGMTVPYFSTPYGIQLGISSSTTAQRDEIFEQRRTIATNLIMAAMGQVTQPMQQIVNPLDKRYVDAVALNLDILLVNQKATVDAILKQLLAPKEQGGAGFTLNDFSKAKDMNEAANRLMALPVSDLANGDRIKGALGISDSAWKAHSIRVEDGKNPDGAVKYKDISMGDPKLTGFFVSQFVYNTSINIGAIVPGLGIVNVVAPTPQQQAAIVTGQPLTTAVGGRTGTITGIEGMPLPGQLPATSPPVAAPGNWQAAAQNAQISSTIVPAYTQTLLAEVTAYNYYTRRSITASYYDGVIANLTSYIRQSGLEGNLANWDVTALDRGWTTQGFADTSHDKPPTDMPAPQVPISTIDSQTAAFNSHYGGIASYVQYPGSQSTWVSGYNPNVWKNFGDPNYKPTFAPFEVFVTTVTKLDEKGGAVDNVTIQGVGGLTRTKGELHGLPLFSGYSRFGTGSGGSWFAVANQIDSSAISAAGMGELVGDSGKTAFKNLRAGTMFGNLRTDVYHESVGFTDKTDSTQNQTRSTTGVSAAGRAGRNYVGSAAVESESSTTGAGATGSSTATTRERLDMRTLREEKSTASGILGAPLGVGKYPAVWGMNIFSEQSKTTTGGGPATSTSNRGIGTNATFRDTRPYGLGPVPIGQIGIQKSVPGDTSLYLERSFGQYAPPLDNEGNPIKKSGKATDQYETIGVSTGSVSQVYMRWVQGATRPSGGAVEISNGSTGTAFNYASRIVDVGSFMVTNLGLYMPTGGTTQYSITISGESGKRVRE